MLKPNYLLSAPDRLVGIYSELENEILKDIARRVARLGKISDATKWQAHIATESGLLKQSVYRVFKRFDRAIQKELYELFFDAMIKSVTADNQVFRQTTARALSDSHAQTMPATIQKTHADLSRLTLTTAESCNRAFIQQANSAYMKVASGAFDANTALKHATQRLAKDGVQIFVSYNNTKPVKRSIESAIRANILTGINQTASTITLDNCQTLGCDLVQVSAHLGARVEHASLQGKIYSLSGTSDKYPPFSLCRYGEATGIGGINCHHSFAPYFEGTKAHYSKEDLKKIASEKVEYNDKEISRYQTEQEQRYIERNIRKYKRSAAIQEGAGFDSSHARAKLGEWQARARDLTKQTGLRRDYTRERIGMPTGRPQIKGIKSQKLSRFEKKKLEEKLKTLYNKPKEYRDTYAKRYGLQINTNKQARHIGENVKKGASYFKTDNETLQKIIQEKAGTGNVSLVNGQLKEIIEDDRLAGFDVDRDGKRKTLKTNRAKIHYSKTGTHIIPCAKKER